jgi:hypothetical protein
LRIGQVLLTNQHERPLRHASGVDLPLGRGKFGIKTGEGFYTYPTP